MKRHRSRLPLVLVLALAGGLMVFSHWRDRSTATMRLVDVTPVGGKSVTMPGKQEPASAPGANLAGLDERIASEGMKLLSARMSRESEDLKVVTHADGRRAVSLEGRFHHMSAVITGADGNPQIRCFNDFHELSDRLENGRSVDPPQPASHDR